jgi:hypothetical protein
MKRGIVFSGIALLVIIVDAVKRLATKGVGAAKDLADKHVGSTTDKVKKGVSGITSGVKGLFGK